MLNRLRIVIEHVNRRLKIFRILSSTYRNRHRRFGLRANLIAGIYNYELEAKELEAKVEMKTELFIQDNLFKLRDVQLRSETRR